jgi:hypothetical protein
VKERVELHNLRTDHVMIRSELKYLIGGKVVTLKCRVFDGKTGPIAVGEVFCVVRPVATVQIRVQPDLEPTLEFGPVANTSWDYDSRLQAESGALGAKLSASDKYIMSISNSKI